MPLLKNDNFIEDALRISAPKMLCRKAAMLPFLFHG